jgi:hypothetical protein
MRLDFDPMPSRETPGSDFEEDLRKAMAAEASNPRKIGHTDDPHASAFADS